jgi:hypothetical protein
MIDLKIKLESMDEADERINLCKRVMTSEMVEKQGELQDVLYYRIVIENMNHF